MVGEHRAPEYRAVPIPLALAAGGVGALAKSIGVGPARLRSPEQNNRIRYGMVDTAAQAVLKGERIVSVTNPGGRRESGAPLELLAHWSQNMATAPARAYASQVFNAVRSREGDGGTFVKGGSPDSPTFVVTGKKKSKKKASSSSAGARTSSGRSSGRGRQQVRYDPATGEKAKFYPDEPEFEAWPRKKPRSATTTTGRRRTEAGRQIDRLTTTFARDALKQGLRLTKATAGGLAALASGAGMTVAMVSALVLAAGAASFFGTRYIMDKLGEAKARRASGSDLALAYRQARAELERKTLGRVGSPPGSLLDKTQHATLAALFKRALAERGLPSYNPPTR